MEATAQVTTANSYDTTIKVVSTVFGTAHFVLQSLADITAHTEGVIVNKVSKGEIQAADWTKHRKDETFIKQQALRAKFAELKAKQQTK